MERLKRLRKELGNCILEEEVKTDEKKSKVKAMRSTTNESNFKTPSQFTPTKRRNSSSTTGSKPGSLNTSGSQPQTNQSSPGLDKRMEGISLNFSK